MAGTVIDSLVVELGLDTSKLDRNQRDALNRLRGFEEEATRRGAAIEKTTENVGNFFDILKRGFVIATAGVAGNAFLKFVDGMSNTAAAVGRTSTALNISTKELSAWQSAARQTGGSAEEITASLSSMSGEVNKFALTGQTSMLPLLGQLNVSMYDQNRNLKTSTQLLLEIADAAQKAFPNDPARRAAILNMLPGMTTSSLNLMMQGRRAMEDYLAAAKAAGGVMEEDSKAAYAYQKSLGLLETAATRLGHTLATSLTPALVSIFDALTNFIKSDNKFERMAGALDPRNNFFSNPAGGALPPSILPGGGFAVTDWLRSMTGGTGTKWDFGSSGGGTRADRNNNPGNIKYGPFAARHGATGADGGGFAVFPSREAGFAAAEALLNSGAYKNLTLRQIGPKWAEGDPNWAQNAARATGLPLDRPLSDDERRVLARQGTTAAEGSKLSPLAGGAVGMTAPASRGVTSTVYIGSITVQTKATDAVGIARDIGPEIKRNAMVAPVNSGQQ